MNIIYIDIETYSEIDLTEAGLYRYAEGRDFAILLFAYSIDGQEVKVIDIANGEAIPQEIVYALQDDSVIKVAHHANFERMCLSRHLGVRLSPIAWRCTLAQCSRMGLPAALGEACKALGTDEVKDENGKRLIRIFCTPQKPTRSNGMRTRITSADAPGMWAQFKEYCAQDVRTEIAIDKATVVGRACGDFENAIYELNAKINDTGVMFDRAFVDAAVKLDGDARARLVDEARRITGLDNPMSPQQLTEWLATRGIKTYSLNATRVEEIMQRTRDIDVLRVLAIRQQLSKISTSKYNTMLACIGEDDRARGLFQYYGTHTGRWSGRLVQLHNLPRTDADHFEKREAVMRGDVDSVELEYGNITDVLSKLVRTAIVAPEGNTLVVCDYSAIEARVLAWLAGESWRLEVFRNDGKIYEATAAKLYGIKPEDIDEGKRRHGKVAELSLGYQGGINALIDMGAKDIGLSYEQLDKTVKTWRADNPNIVKLWREAQDAVMYCIKTGDITTLPHGITCELIESSLYITLPSGRYIAYHGAYIKDNSVHYIEADYKRTHASLYGGKIVENIVQGIARDCLAEAMLRIDAQGYRIVGHVHDEVIVEVDADDTVALDLIKSIFDQAPAWATGLPLRGEGFITQYYRK